MLGPDADQARKTMHRLWANEEIPGETAQLLPLPRHFEQFSQIVTADMGLRPCGLDPDPHHAVLRQFADAGFDEAKNSKNASGALKRDDPPGWSARRIGCVTG